MFTGLEIAGIVAALAWAFGLKPRDHDGHPLR